MRALLKEHITYLRQIRNLNTDVALWFKVPNNIIDHSTSDIEVIYEPDRVINVSAELISEANVKLDYCLDSMGLSYFIVCEPI